MPDHPSYQERLSNTEDAGLLDWDDTSIVFTKRTLIEFLKFVTNTIPHLSVEFVQ